jgi:proline iminopeptidase
MIISRINLFLIFNCIAFYFGVIQISYTQEIYYNTFGDSTDQPIIYLEGGPGASCIYFEKLVAPKLADEGFFVIAYDRRGEGRSGIFEEQKEGLEYTGKLTDPIKYPEKPNFKTAFDEIDSLIQLFNLENATLLGQSFGGILATLYADSFPEKVNAIILSGAPIDIPATFRHALTESKKRFLEKKDSSRIAQINYLESLDSAVGLPYFMVESLVLESGYVPELNLNKEGQLINSKIKDDSLEININVLVSASYSQDINYSLIDYLALYEGLNNKGVEIYGLYGQSDYRCPPFIIDKLKEVLGEKNVLYLDQCGHATLLHRRTTAINGIKNWLK